jgi:subtilisin family serine protease
MVDYVGSAGAYTYQLIYTKLDTTPPTIASVTPVEPKTRATPVSSLTVTFSKPIDPHSFTTAALTLTLNGGANLINSSVTITPTDSSNTAFTISGLAGLTAASGSYKLLIDPSHVEDASQNFGAGAPTELDWVVDTTHAVATVTPVAPATRNTAVATVNVTFSQPINPSSFTSSALKLTRGSDPTNLITSAVTIRKVGNDGTAYQITALDGLTQTNGTYTLTVDATQVTDTGGAAGVGADTTSWVMDTVAPTITSLEQVVTNPRNIVVPHLDVTFSKPINLATFTTAALTLTRSDSKDTSDNLIGLFTDPDRAVTITPVVGTTSTYRINNINWPQGFAGTYTLTVNGATIQDPAGNTVSGKASSSWTIELETPAAPTSLAISPDNGISSIDGVTNTTSITLSGYAPQPNMRVEIYDVTESDDFGSVFSSATPTTLPGGGTGYAWSEALTLTTSGHHNLRARDVDAAQNVSAYSFFDAFIDLTPPTVAALGTIASPQSSPVASETVTFSKPINPATFDYHALMLTLNGGANLITSAVTVTPTDSTDTTFTIGGLAALNTSQGNYVLTVDPTSVQDLAGNNGVVIPMMTANTASWTESQPGTAPPASTVQPFPGEVLPNPATIHTTSFTVSWTAQDNSGSGLAHVNLYVSDNGGPFTLWKQEPASATSDTYVGVEQHTYGFVSQAVDNAGDVEPQRTAADASVFLSIQGQIRGRVFEDVNQAGMDSSTAPGLKGWTVFLDLQNDGQLDQGDPRTTTDTNGNFVFSGLEPGTYTVAEVVQPGWALTFPGGGSSSVKERSIKVGATDAPVYLAATPAPGGTPSTTAANQALIGLTQFENDPRFSGINGQGETIAVLDSGVDVTNPYFGPVGANGLAAGIAYQYDFVDNTTSAPDSLGHGSVVASVIGSRDTTNPGIAPGVQIIDLKVLDANGNGDFSNVSRALQWVADNAAKYNIVAVNMSFGDGGNYSQPLSLYGIGGLLQQLAAENVISVAASGNNFFLNGSIPGVAYPSADPNVLSVGAVWSANVGGPYQWSNGAIDYTTAPDQIMSFSQRDPNLTAALAPGGFITGAGPNGGVATFSGTSMAAPDVAGIAALAQQLAIQQLGRRLTTSEFRALLNLSSDLVRDSSTTGANGIIVHPPGCT